MHTNREPSSSEFCSSDPGVMAVDGVSGDVFMKDMESIKRRYPGLSGLLLYKKVTEHWALDKNRTFKFFTNDCKELLSRHPINKNRGQVSVVDAYKESILKNGLLPSVRGRAIAVPKSVSSSGMQTEDQPHWLIGHATLTEAVYKANQEQPENPMVVETLKQGLPDALVLSPRTPQDILLWIKDGHISFHQGVSVTLLEFVDKAVSACAAWSAELNRMNKKVKDLPSAGPNTYQKKMEAFILKNYDNSNNFYQYRNTIAFVDLFKEYPGKGSKVSSYEKWCHMLSSFGDFMDPRIDNATIVLNMHKVTLVMLGSTFFKDVHSPEIIEACLLAAFSIFFPMKFAGDETATWHVLGSIVNRDHGFKAPMAGSVVHRHSQKKGHLRTTVALGTSLGDECE